MKDVNYSIYFAHIFKASRCSFYFIAIGMLLDTQFRFNKKQNISQNFLSKLKDIEMEMC